METKNTSGINKGYVIGVSFITFVLPVICAGGEMMLNKGTPFSFALVGKWFIFAAVGIRLTLAGIRQATNPAFTAKEIFHIDSPESFPIVRELGFANLCFGLIGIVALFAPSWLIVSAFGSGLYYGIAGVQHLIKKPVGGNEKFALITDLIIFAFLLLYFVKMI